MSEEEELEKIGVQKCEKCGTERPLLNPITPCPCELSGELRPALSWKDALLRINELQKEIDRLKDIVQRKDAIFEKIDGMVGHYAYKSPEEGFCDQLTVLSASVHQQCMDALRMEADNE